MMSDIRAAHVAVAREQLEWSDNFKGGMFHVHCHKCGVGEPYLPPEFFGLLETADMLANAVLDLHGAERSPSAERTEPELTQASADRRSREAVQATRERGY